MTSHNVWRHYMTSWYSRTFEVIWGQPAYYSSIESFPEFGYKKGERTKICQIIFDTVSCHILRIEREKNKAENMNNQKVILYLFFISEIY